MPGLVPTHGRPSSGIRLPESLSGVWPPSDTITPRSSPPPPDCSPSMTFMTSS